MPFDPLPYADGIRRANERELAQTRRRAALARTEARSLADRIAQADRDIVRVYLFGSLREDPPRNPDFDIDLAIDGGDVYRAVEATESSPWRVDVVSLQLVPEHVRRRILESGEVLYSRSPSS